MSGSKPKPPDKPDAKPDDRRSGRVAFDERGNAVWEWSMSTGIFGRNVDTKRLKKLEANDLRIADDPSPQAGSSPAAPASRANPPAKLPGGGGDPYNSSGAGVGRGPAVAKPKGPAKQKDLKRLSEWIQLQKSLGKKTDKD